MEDMLITTWITFHISRILKKSKNVILVITRDVSQYGTDYIQINCSENYSLTFTGSPTVKILPFNGEEGNHFCWSNKTDVSDMSMTQEFDLQCHGAISLNYSMWYDMKQITITFTCYPPPMAKYGI